MTTVSDGVEVPLTDQAAEEPAGTVSEFGPEDASPRDVLRLRVVLPPGWLDLDLDDDDHCERQARRLTDAISSDDGQGARLRREARTTLLEQVRAARSGGATILAISGPEVPFLSGSLVVRPLPDSQRVDGEEDWLVESDARVDRATIPAGAVVRRVTHVDASEGGDPVSSVAVDYWLRSPTGSTVHLAFSSPLFSHADALTGLFDAVVESTAWMDGDGRQVTPG